MPDTVLDTEASDSGAVLYFGIRVIGLLGWLWEAAQAVTGFGQASGWLARSNGARIVRAAAVLQTIQDDQGIRYPTTGQSFIVASGIPRLPPIARLLGYVKAPYLRGRLRRFTA